MLECKGFYPYRWWRGRAGDRDHADDQHADVVIPISNWHVRRYGERSGSLDADRADCDHDHAPGRHAQVIDEDYQIMGLSDIKAATLIPTRRWACRADQEPERLLDGVREAAQQELARTEGRISVEISIRDHHREIPARDHHRHVADDVADAADAAAAGDVQIRESTSTRWRSSRCR